MFPIFLNVTVSIVSDRCFSRFSLNENGSLVIAAALLSDRNFRCCVRIDDNETSSAALIRKLQKCCDKMKRHVGVVIAGVLDCEKNPCGDKGSCHVLYQGKGLEKIECHCHLGRSGLWCKQGWQRREGWQHVFVVFMSVCCNFAP